MDVMNKSFLNGTLFFVFRYCCIFFLTIVLCAGCDSGGGSSGSGDGNSALDETPPEISLTGQYDTPLIINTPSIVLEGAASDNQRVGQIVWKTDKEKSGVATGIDPWTAEVSLVEGENNITVTAEDTAGNKSSVSLAVIYDNTPPEVIIRNPTDEPSYSVDTPTIEITGSATDAHGIQSVQWTAGNQVGQASGTESWQTRITLDAGETMITVTAKDMAGNTGSDTLTVIFTEAVFHLAGSVIASSNTSVDSDVNDPNAPYSNNDNAENAQNIYAPVTLGGYVNQPGKGHNGRSFAGGDVNDVYRVKLMAGEHITLNMAASVLDADLDLYIYDAASLTLIDSSVSGSSRTEYLTTPDDGMYLIQIVAYKGASNYALTIGRVGQATEPNTLKLSSRFVAGEVLINLSKSLKTATSQFDQLSSYELKLKKGDTGRIGLYSVTNDKPMIDSTRRLSTSPINQYLLEGTFIEDEDRDKLHTLFAVKNLRKQSHVKTADPNYIHTICQTPDDEYYPLQWHYPLINLPEAWDITTGSSDVTVAVVDTGIITNHPDIQDQLSREGYDFISDPDQALDGDGIDDNPEDPGDVNQESNSFHGTHVAGTVAAKTDNGTGVAGVAWKTRIMPIRTLGKGGTGTSYDTMQGVRYAAGLDNDAGVVPETPADIINLSLGGSDFSSSEQELYTTLREAGIIVIAAAGNSASKLPFYPAAYDGVVSVSAVGIGTDLAPYSNFGPTIDVAAPGGDFSTDLNGDGYVDGVLSTSGEGSATDIEPVYTFLQGTSMATPHVSGVVALMKAIRPSLTFNELEGLLANGSIVQDLGETGRDDYYGFGLIDAKKAVLAAGEGEIPTILNVSPTSLNLGSSIDKAMLTTSAVGDDTIHVTGISDNADWLSVSSFDTDQNGLGTYDVTIDRDGLPDGPYSATINFVSSENRVDVSVTMRVETTSRIPDAGLHYVLLLDSATNETIRELVKSSNNGRYEYVFTDVEPGNYLIYAGTDSDNDFVIGDLGEAVGVYISTDQPTVLNVDKDLAELDFVTEFNLNVRESGDFNALEKPERINKTRSLHR